MTADVRKRARFRGLLCACVYSAIFMRGRKRGAFSETAVLQAVITEKKSTKSLYQLFHNRYGCRGCPLTLPPTTRKKTGKSAIPNISGDCAMVKSGDCVRFSGGCAARVAFPISGACVEIRGTGALLWGCWGGGARFPVSLHGETAGNVPNGTSAGGRNWTELDTRKGGDATEMPRSVYIPAGEYDRRCACAGLTRHKKGVRPPAAALDTAALDAGNYAAVKPAFTCLASVHRSRAQLTPVPTYSLQHNRLRAACERVTKNARPATASAATAAESATATEKAV